MTNKLWDHVTIENKSSLIVWAEVKRLQDDGYEAVGVTNYGDKLVVLMKRPVKHGSNLEGFSQWLEKEVIK